MKDGVHATSDPDRRHRRWFALAIVAGAVLIALGAGDMLRARLTHPEKNAYYILGHWADAVWEIQVPLIVLGAAVLVTAFLVRRSQSHGRRATDDGV